jgi:hypothetical protein
MTGDLKSGKKMNNFYNFAAKLLCSTMLAIFFFPLTAETFNIPEKFVFDLTWTGVKAGTATLEITNDKDLINIVSTARSADWVSVFYTVEDRIESRLARTGTNSIIGLPQKYRIKTREGSHRRDNEIVFDMEKRKAVFINHLDGKNKDADIEENTFDPLSCFYYVRTLKLEAGKSVFVDMFDSKKMWNVEVQVLRKEKIKTSLGIFDTVVIKPLMKSEGIFNRKGDMYIWLTDDRKHIPVKMQTKVAVGSITATLISGIY